jgi:hypothetical protein
MTALSDLTARLADRRTIDRATAADLLLDQVIAHDLILGTITDPQDIPADLAGDLINAADATYSAAGALALGEVAHPAPGVTIVPARHT